MKDLQTFITEGLSSILFHYTSVTNIIEILKKNKFLLSTNVGTKSDSDDEMGMKGRVYYFSMARSPSSSYFGSYGLTAYLELDGKALGQKYKGAPVNYWGSGFGKNEMEDRIFHNKSEIPNANKYITKIHVLLPYKPTEKLDWFAKHALKKKGIDVDEYEKNIKKVLKWDREDEKIWVRKILLNAKKNNIKTFFYENEKNFIARRKSISISIEDLKISEEITKWVSVSYRRKLFEQWLALAFTPVKNKRDLPDSAVSRLTYLNSIDSLHSLTADIHNNKGGGKADSIIAAFKFMKAKTPKEFLDALAKKWR